MLDHLGVRVSAHTINVWSLVLFGLACLGVLGLGLAARSTPRAAQLAFVLVAAFLLVNKVYSPQYVLWLLPLAVLARPSWRDLLIWQAGEVLYFGAVWLYLGNWLQDASATASPAYDVAILVRIAAEIYLIGMVVRDVWRGPGPDSPPDDLVEQRRGEPHPEVELVADRGSV